MKHARLDEMVKGWFAGDFEPSALRTNQFEAAVKYYKAGEHESRHVHRIATEITVVVQGKVRMNDKDYESGDIVTIPPGESTDFIALTDAATAVIKVPSVMGDKYSE